MRHLYLLRHGESKLNASGHFAGRVETPLTNQGRALRAVAQDSLDLGDRSLDNARVYQLL